MQKLEIMRFQVWVRAQQRELHQAISANPFMRISSASPKDGLTEVQVPQNAWPMLSSLEGSWCNCQAKTAKSPVAAGVYQAVSSSFPWTESRKTGGRFRHTRSHKLPNTCNCLGVVIHDHYISPGVTMKVTSHMSPQIWGWEQYNKVFIIIYDYIIKLCDASYSSPIHVKHPQNNHNIFGMGWDSWWQPLLKKTSLQQLVTHP